MSYLEVFGVLTRVGVDVLKFFGVGSGVPKPETGAESESEKFDSAYICQTDYISTPDLLGCLICFV